jgi:hypothetical protein
VWVVMGFVKEGGIIRIINELISIFLCFAVREEVRMGSWESQAVYKDCLSDSPSVPPSAGGLWKALMSVLPKVKKS